MVSEFNKSPTIAVLEKTIAVLEKMLEGDSQPKIHVNSDGSIGVEKQISDIAKYVAALESDSHELGEIRATLLLNFGNSKHNRYGFVVQERPSTLRMLMQIFEHFVKPISCLDGEK